jgi:protein-S-isoprenylcysteine O-methyltransferase Ste14
MSLTPAFEIGVWNAWIFMLYTFLPMPLIMLFHRDWMREEFKPQSETERKLNTVMWIIWLAGVVYSVFLPLRVGTMWFYVGLPISMIGLIAFTAVIVTLLTTPIDKEPLTKGLYRFSRHPMYITQLAMFVGVGIACASWVFLIYTVVYTIPAFIYVASEERRCLDKYGDAYLEYMNRTPRWIGLPKK